MESWATLTISYCIEHSEQSQRRTQISETKLARSSRLHSEPPQIRGPHPVLIPVSMQEIASVSWAVDDERVSILIINLRDIQL